MIKAERCTAAFYRAQCHRTHGHNGPHQAASGGGMHTTWTDDASDPILTLWCDRCDQPFQTNTITTLCRPCQQAADTCRITTRTELRFAHAHARNNPQEESAQA